MEAAWPFSRILFLTHMKNLFYPFLLAMLATAGPLAAQDFTITHRGTNEAYANCGYAFKGTYADTLATNVHHTYYTVPPGCATSACYQNVSIANGKERSYTLTFNDSIYLLINQEGVNLQSIYLCGDNANNTRISSGNTGGSLTWVYEHLGPGTYYVNIEQRDPAVQNYEFNVVCSNAPIPYQNLKPLAQAVAINTVFSGNMVGQTSHVNNWLQFYKYANYYTYDQVVQDYQPEPDRLFKFTVPYKSTVRVQKLSNTDHREYLVDTSGRSVFPLDTDYDLSPGVYYMGIEQGSGTASENYSYQVKAIRSACAPTIAARPTYPCYYYPCNGGVSAGVNNGTLYVGGTNNVVHVTSLSGYVRLFVDFNADGDFDDPSETIYTTTVKRNNLRPSYYGGSPGYDQYGLLIDNFPLSAGNAVFAGAIGKTLRMRCLVSDTLLGGACGSYQKADYSDDFITVAAGQANNQPTKWVRQTSDAGIDKTIRTRTAPDGSVYSLSQSGTSPVYDYSAGTYLAQVNPKITSDPGKGVQVFATTRHHGYISDISTVNKYSKNGTLLWSVPIVATGSEGSSSPSVKVTGMAVDKFGYVYVCGTYRFYINLNLTNNLDDPGYHNFYMEKGFVAKFHPSDGHFVYGFNLGGNGTDANYSATTMVPTGLDVAPDMRLYVAGQFNNQGQVTGVSGTKVLLTSRGNYDTFLAKFSDVGTLYWAVQGGGPGNDFAYGAAADKLGGGYLLGSYEGTCTFNSNQAGTTPISKTAVGGSDGFVLSVPVTGQLNWVASMGGVANENVRDVCADPRGTGVVAVGGFSNTAQFGATTLTSTGYYDAFAVRLSNSGAFEWATKAGGFGQDQAYSVRLDRTGNPFVGFGFSQSISAPFGAPAITTAGGTDGAIIKLGAATGQATNSPIIISGRGLETVLGVDTAEQGGAVASGTFGLQASFPGWGNLAGLATAPPPYYYSTTDTTNADGWLAKFGATAALPASPPSSGRGGEEPALPAGLLAWPNPGTGELSVSLAGLPAGTHRLTALDANGRRVFAQDLSSEELAQGRHLDIRLSPGLYIIRVAGKSCRVVVN